MGLDGVPTKRQKMPRATWLQMLMLKEIARHMGTRSVPRARGRKAMKEAQVAWPTFGGGGHLAIDVACRTRRTIASGRVTRRSSG